MQPSTKWLLGLLLAIGLLLTTAFLWKTRRDARVLAELRDAGATVYFTEATGGHELRPALGGYRYDGVLVARGTHRYSGPIVAVVLPNDMAVGVFCAHPDAFYGTHTVALGLDVTHSGAASAIRVIASRALPLQYLSTNGVELSAAQLAELRATLPDCAVKQYSKASEESSDTSRE